MHIIPLVLIIFLLIFILVYIQPATDHARRNGKSREPESEIPDEDESLLSHDEAQDISFLQGDSLSQDAKDRTFRRLTAEIASLKHKNARKAKEVEIARKSTKKLQQDLFTSISQNKELQRQYETLSRDLDGARLFLNTADTFSDSEIIQLLQRLNAELQHTSTFMTDRAVSVFKLDAGKSAQGHQAVVDRASKSVGSALVQFLWAAVRDDSEVPMYLQIAFQACLTHHLHCIVSSWTLDERHNAFLDDMYQRLRESEKQALSGRWRSLTHIYALPNCVSEPSSLIALIIAGLSDILLAAGCTASRTNTISELTSMFEKKISPVISLAGRLDRMIGEVVSGDFEVFVVRPGETFHTGRMEEDLDGDEAQGASDRTRTAQTVLCTSELGLTKRVQLSNGEKETKTVIKAKVVLESFLDQES